MTKFNTETSLKTEHAATLLSETELDAVSGGAGGPVDPVSGSAGGMINPQPLPPRHGPTSPRQW